MYIPPSTKRSQASIYSQYLIDCDKIRKKGKPCLKNLQRVLRNTCKTTLLGDAVLCFRLKKQKKIAVKMTYANENYVKDVYYFKIFSSKFPNVEFRVSAVNARELMAKINYFYSLLEA